MPTSANPTVVQTPGPYTVPVVDDNRGWRFTSTLSRPVATQAAPTPPWSLTTTLGLATTQPANALHRVVLGQSMTFAIPAELAADNLAMEARLKFIYDHLADMLIPPSAAVVIP